MQTMIFGTWQIDGRNMPTGGSHDSIAPKPEPEQPRRMALITAQGDRIPFVLLPVRQASGG